MPSRPGCSPSATPQAAPAPGTAPCVPRRALLGAGAVAGLAVAGLLGACGKQEAAPKPETPAPKPDAAATGKVYAVGTDATNAPFESENDKGDIIGFDVELLQAVAAKAGIEVEVINTPWEGLLTALEQGDLDAAVSSITITDERRQTLDFSTPYFDAQQLIVVPTASRVAHLHDLKSLRVGVQDGAAGDDLVTPLFSRNSAAIQRFESIPLALTELEAKNVDAVVADNGVLAHYVTHNDSNQFRLVNDPAFEREQIGIAVKKGNAELLKKINAGLAAIHADGSYARIYQRYFGAPPGAGAAAGTAASR